MKKIVMTGGGTAGHVTPNIALMPALKEAGYDIEYIGSVNGMEKGLIEAQKIPYHGISSGKRKNLKNFSKEVIKSHLAVLIWCGKRDKHFSNHKGKEVRLMT